MLYYKMNITYVDLFLLTSIILGVSYIVLTPRPAQEKRAENRRWICDNIEWLLPGLFLFGIFFVVFYCILTGQELQPFLTKPGSPLYKI